MTCKAVVCYKWSHQLTLVARQCSSVCSMQGWLNLGNCLNQQR